MTATAVHCDEATTSRIGELAAGAYPLEGCGVLIGRIEGSKVTIVDATSAENLVTSRAHDRYELNPADYVKADALARERGLDVVGFWHSHPDHPARPSRLDSARAWPDYVYVICRTTVAGVEDIAAFSLPVEGALLEPVSMNGTVP